MGRFTRLLTCFLVYSFIHPTNGLKYFDTMQVGCFPPSLEDKRKHFLQLADARSQWTPNPDVADGTFALKLAPLGLPLGPSRRRMVEYEIAVGRLKAVVPNLKNANFISVQILGSFAGGVHQFARAAHRRYHEFVALAANLTSICREAGYTVNKCFFTVIVSRRMCDEAQLSARGQPCGGLEELLRPEFHDEGHRIVDEVETIFTVSHMLNKTNVQFMVML